MFSRFWYFVLAAATGFALACALLAQTAFDRQTDTQLDDRLRRDRLETELLLRMEARTRLDAIAPIAAHGEVREALRASSARRPDADVDAALRGRLQQRLEELNRQLDEARADLLIAIDATGDMVTQLGGTTPPPGASLAAMPLADRALRGYEGDDVWVWNSRVFRMAARPVVDQGRYVGAILHGKVIDVELARRLAERLPGASVAFFQGPQVFATYAPGDVAGAPSAPDVTSALPTALGDEELKAGRRTEPLPLGESARGLYSLVTGSASHAQVGYAIARPRTHLASATTLFFDAPSEDVSALPWVSIAGIPILLGLLGVLFVWLERDRPFARLRDEVNDVTRGAAQQLVPTDFRGAFRRFADEINRALLKASEREGGAAPARSAQSLDEILGKEGAPAGASSSQPYFGFASKDAGPSPALAPAMDLPAVPPPGSGPVRPPAPRKDPTSPTLTGQRAPIPVPKPMPPAAAPVAKPVAPPPAAAAPPPPKPAPLPPAPAPAPFAMPVAPQAPAPFVTPNAPAAAAGAASVEEEFEDEGATMVAEIPRELIAAATDESTEAQEDRHFREVFEEYLKIRKQCGEPTAGLTFDKFVETLRKNRDTIVSQHGAKTVRFAVYVKSGKAALKATPIKA